MSDEELSLEQIEKIIKAIKDNPELQDSTFILLQALFGHIVNLERIVTELTRNKFRNEYVTEYKTIPVPNKKYYTSDDNTKYAKQYEDIMKTVDDYVINHKDDDDNLPF
ncbi:hypothetical protein HN682_03360 [Candidatus Peregrinibacteria bacterium]|mgnify:CR=1 FL=1|jgi:hypothetical protein|nr:hypothetical protein [Candidatus Peregrinibacteria bacterium]